MRHPMGMKNPGFDGASYERRWDNSKSWSRSDAQGTNPLRDAIEASKQKKPSNVLGGFFMPRDREWSPRSRCVSVFL